MRTVIALMLTLPLLACEPDSLMDQTSEALDDGADAITEAIEDAGDELDDIVDEVVD